MTEGPVRPIASSAQLSEAMPDLINRQIRWQLIELRSHQDLTQEAIGLYIERDQSYVSRLANGTLNLQIKEALALDKNWSDPNWFPFADLVSARVTRTKQQPKQGQSTVRKSVFVASPMSVPTGTYKESRNLALDLVTVLRNRCNFEVYYAGEELPTVEDFDAADLAYEINLKALKESSHFILLWEGPPKDNARKREARPKTVSSIWVEAGMALAMRMPSTYFVPDLTALPYILQQASKQNSSAPVNVRPFGDDPRASINLVRSNGARLFS
jgi:hypothetical protein